MNICKQRLGILVAAGCLSVAVGAQAEPMQERFPIDLAEAEQRAAQRFAQADSNGDGFVDLAEFEAVEPWHRGGHGFGPGGDRSHRKGGGGGTGRHGSQKGPHHQFMQQAMADEAFAILDSDGNGNIDKSEFKSQDQKTVRTLAFKRAMFKMRDGDSDGRLSQAEMPNRLMHLRAADANTDGKVDRDEFRSAMRARMQARSQQD